MAIYHVTTAGDDGTGDGSLSFPWRTIGFGLTQLTPGGASFDSSPDELLVWRDPAQPYVETIASPVSSGLKIIAVDEDGRRADAPGWGRDLVVVDSSGAVVDGLAAGPWQHWIGFHFDGGGTNTQNGILAQELWLEDCWITDFTKLGATNIAAGSKLWRSTFADNGDRGAWSGGAANVEARSCLFLRNGGGGIFAVGPGVLLEHLTAIGNGGPATAAIAASGSPGLGTVRNCLAADNTSAYGIQCHRDSMIRCNSYSSGPSFHTSGDFTDSPTQGWNSDVNPQLDEDYRPLQGGPITLDGDEGTTTTLDLDGRTFARPRPTRGALETIGVGSGGVGEDNTIRWTGDIAGEPYNDLTAYEPMALGRDTLLSASGAALLSDRRVSPDEEGAPTGWGADLKGWWADPIHRTKFGSRMHLLNDALQTDATATRAAEFAAEAMDWATEQQVATDVEADSALVGQRGVRVEVTTRRVEDGRDLRFGALWE